ncbi:ThuA domain-containing protein [Pseudochryseolinea flava]|nr:ThuA domain-containing protein [Pseudochryseolinea flava]
MKYYVTLLCFLLLLAGCAKKRSGNPRVLVFSKTAGYHHESIPQGVAAIQKLAAQNSFDVDTTTNANWFHEDSLKKYSAIIFLSTTGDVFNQYQERAFERYIQAGGGFVGIHAATDTEYDWGWYTKLVGGQFADHPQIQDADLHIVDKDHPATKHLPETWTRKDEWYSFKKVNTDTKVLMKIDEKSYQGGSDMGEHPMSWYHNYDGGRAFYTALGHTNESYQEEAFLKHLLGGIQYAIGDNHELNYNKVTTVLIPEEDRFTKTTLVAGEFFEPVEMTILPNLDILVAQRRGEILLYKNGSNAVKQVAFLNSYNKATRPDVNAEEGVLGIQADPNFSKNHYVYVFYSPSDTSVNRLSRFKFENDIFDLKSEKIVLQFYSQRNICCHTGGSIAFDKDGLLFVSTGDNSTPFDESNQRYVSHGYAPLDDRKGHEQYDARRTSGNANDLRGKILRIKLNEDGSYTIPEGNLYPEGTANTRPEIYVQGNRNPYRISVDKKNGFLYWGEVGPDANVDSLETRGPRGYDEVNQARKAGFFGWPLFIANNIPYHAFDYETGKTGPLFDPQKPVNTSLNNTGIKELPPAQPAFIWYPYGPSSDFPQVKAGGRNAMAGPAYYTDMFPEATRLPEYFNEKVFIYDWVRGWVKVVTLESNGDFSKMEPFMENTKLNALIDMEVGPDGKLYYLEYGNGWFSKNKDAAISRIDYNAGNLAPKISSFKIDKTSGALPFTIELNAVATDLESKTLTYRWNLGNGEQKETQEPRYTYTYNKPGEFKVSLTVIDSEKQTASSDGVTIFAGNEMPEVAIDIAGNKSFYFPGKKIKYTVTVKDKDDPAADKNTAGLYVAADYLESSDRVSASIGHQGVSETMIGKNLTQSLDCKACHKEAEKSIGPSYADVAARYQKDPDVFNKLSQKIIKGGSGVWGETNMPAHADLKETEAKQIVTWIMSLVKSESKKSLPASGVVNATVDKPILDQGILLLSASYTDIGGKNITPLTASTEVTLRNNKVFMNDTKNRKDFRSYYVNGVRMLITPQVTGSFAIEKVDLTGIKTLDLSTFWDIAPENDYTYEVRLDSPDGTKVGSGILKSPKKDNATQTLVIPITTVTDGKFHSVFIVSHSSGTLDKGSFKLKTLTFKD